MAREICQLSLIGVRDDWYNYHSHRKQILLIPPPMTIVQLVVYSATFRVSQAHQIQFKLHLK